MHSENNTADNELAIGICGHRWVRESLELLSAIDKVVEKIEQDYSFQSLKLVSPLAEGADRVVAKQMLLSSNAALVALFPFPVEDYLVDFSTPVSVREFRDLFVQANQVIELPGHLNREEAYVALGKTLLDQSDVLIAVWDGKPANGRGGTAEIVQEARERGMPLAWIHHTQPGKMETVVTPDAVQMRLIFERFPSQNTVSGSENEYGIN